MNSTSEVSPSSCRLISLHRGHSICALSLPSHTHSTHSCYLGSAAKKPVPFFVPSLQRQTGSNTQPAACTPASAKPLSRGLSGTDALAEAEGRTWESTITSTSPAKNNKPTGICLCVSEAKTNQQSAECKHTREEQQDLMINHCGPKADWNTGGLTHFSLNKNKSWLL